MTKKLPRDPNQRAKAIMEMAFTDEKDLRSAAAAAMGKKGGAARAKALTAEKRKEISQKAIKARWDKAKDNT